MVNGLDTFKAYFSDYKDCYVLIGGSACDVYFTDQDLPFRVTEDLDMILCVEALSPAFFARFWSFVREGGYANRQKANGDRQFYRFTNPSVPGFPKMLELFARKADFLSDDAEGHLTPIPAGEEASSLSGILLEQGYYDFGFYSHLSGNDEMGWGSRDRVSRPRGRSSRSIPRRCGNPLPFV